jgi:hypothetical protein
MHDLLIGFVTYTSIRRDFDNFVTAVLMHAPVPERKTNQAKYRLMNFQSVVSLSGRKTASGKRKSITTAYD